MLTQYQRMKTFPKTNISSVEGDSPKKVIFFKMKTKPLLYLVHSYLAETKIFLIFKAVNSGKIWGCRISNVDH
jgi:hypothetical protein